MSGILIGDDECTISELVNEFLKPSMEVVMMDRWSHFANTLQVPLKTVKKLRRDLLHDKIAYADISNELLTIWRSRRGRNATVGNLLSIIMTNFVWKEIEDFLRMKIQQNAKNYMDLDDELKARVLNSKIRFLGNERYLISIQSLMKQDDFADIVNEFVDRELIQQCLQKGVTQLDNLKLPKKLPYYISRTLEWKRQLNPVVFQEPVPDIFLFEGIQRHQLSILANPNQADISGCQLDNQSVRFILLELEDDFKEICSHAEVPVHRILFKDDKYYWIFTAGSLRIVRSFLLDDETEEINEQILVGEHLAIFSSRPLAIVSSPGMGKSVLLGSIAHRVHAEYPDRIVLFMEMASFFKHQNVKLEEPNLRTIKDIIASYVSNNRFGQALVRKLLNDDKNQFEVFLDGFDEISLDQVDAAKKILACFPESKNIRAHISSRHHMRTELEDAIGVISFDIVPFQPADQIRFLCGFWENQLEIQNTERLTSFASIVIGEIFSDYIGIPLQCFMLAEIHSKDALRYSKLETDWIRITNFSGSLFDLYSVFFETKFEMFAELDRDKIRKYHWVEALKLLFFDNEFATSIYSTLENELSQQLALENIYAVGILETGRATDCPSFVHRTLAQFLVGDMIVEHLGGNLLCDCQSFVPFVLESVLETCIDTQKLDIDDDTIEWIVDIIESSRMLQNGSFNGKWRELMSVLIPHVTIPEQLRSKNYFEDIFTFWRHQMGKKGTFGALLRVLNNLKWTEIVNELTNTVSTHAKEFTFINSEVCFFLNAKLAKYKTTVIQSSHLLLHVKKYQQTADKKSFGERFKIIWVLTKNCHKHFLAVIIPMFWDKRDAPPTYYCCQKLLICAATYGNVNLFQYCCKVVDELSETKVSEIGFEKLVIGDIEFEDTPFHCALEMGNYELTEYLSHFYEDKLAGMNFLYESLLQDSYEDSPDIINNKRSIIFLLKSSNVHFDVRSFENCLQAEILSIELIICISDAFGYSPSTHHAKFITDSFTFSVKKDSQINLYVDWLASNSQDSLLMYDDAANIRNAMYENILLPQTFAKICKLCHNELSLILDSAVRCKYAEEFVKIIVDISGNANIADSEGMTMLHLAALYKKPNVIRYLLSVGADMYAMDNEANLPLALAYGDKNKYKFNQVQDCQSLLADSKPKLFKIMKLRRLFRTLKMEPHFNPFLAEVIYVAVHTYWYSIIVVAISYIFISIYYYFS